MNQYHKIQTIYKREQFAKNRLMIGVYSWPEFEYLKDNKWVFTEKVDGTNIRVMYTKDGISFGGKTDNAQMPMPLMTRLQEMFDTTPQRKKFKELFQKEGEEDPQVCLYGEGYGAKIQKGGGNYKKDGVDFVLFDVKVGEWWLQREDIEKIAETLGIRVVPIIGEGTLDDAIEMTKKGIKSQWGDFTAEGLVIKPQVELQTRGGNRIITKIKHRDFLNAS